MLHENFRVSMTSDVGVELKAFLNRHQLPRLRPVSLLELGLVQVPVYSDVEYPHFAANLSHSPSNIMERYY